MSPRRGVGIVASEAVLVAYVILIIVFLAEPVAYWGWPSVAADGDGRILAVIATASGILVLMRRRLPSVALVAAALLLGRYLETGVALAAISYGVAHRIRPMRRQMVALALAVIAPTVVAFIAHDASTHWRSLAAVIGAGTLACVVIPSMVGGLLAQRENLVKTLRIRTTYLERAHQLTVTEARLQERSRVAEEMHDVLGHRLSLISLYAGALELEAAKGAPRLADEARLVRTTARTALNEMRAVLGILRTGHRGQVPELTDETGTRADLQRLVDESATAGIIVTLSWSGTDLDGVDAPSRAAVHRLVREGLTNVHKHAASARIRVEIARAADRITVEVRNGPNAPSGGAALPGEGLGLLGLQERVRLLGGVFDAGPSDDGGFSVRAELPLSDAGRPRLSGGSEPVTEFLATAPEIRRASDARSRLGMVLVSGAGLLSVAALLIATLEFLVPSNVREPNVRIGMTEAAVRRLVGGSEPLAELAASGREFSVPEGATCWYVAGETSDGGRVVSVDRYCFAAGRLIEKKHLNLALSGR